MEFTLNNDHKMKKWIMAGAMMTLLLGCGSKGTETTEANAPTQETSAPAEKTSNGKWIVNPEMSPHVKAGAALVGDYLKAGDKDYQVLASNLEAKNQDLINSCTMSGKSHDALHEWLAPHLSLVKQLKSSMDPDSAQALVLEIEASYKQYDEGFE